MRDVAIILLFDSSVNILNEWSVLIKYVAALLGRLHNPEFTVRNNLYQGVLSIKSCFNSSPLVLSRMPQRITGHHPSLPNASST